MASNVPTIGQLSWPALLPQFIVIGLFFYIYDSLGTETSFLYAALTYCVLALLLRNLLAKDHRKGIRLVKQLKFTEAIPYFEKSVIFFARNSWVDKFRSLTLLSASKLSYKEMGLANIAFCYSQTNNGQKAKEYYERILSEFPNNGLALAGLKMVTSMAHLNVENKL